MTTADTMSQDLFDQNWPTIARQVQMILAAKGRVRKDLRIVAVYAKSTGELLAEVLRTTVGPVVVYRMGHTGYTTVRNHPETESAQHIVGVRVGRGAMKFDVQPFTGSANQFFPVTTPRRPIPIGDGERKNLNHFVLSAQHIIDRDSLGGELVFH